MRNIGTLNFSSNARKPHWVYRLYNADGVMIYAGCTVDLAKRLTQHSLGRPWWNEVRGIESERYGTLLSGRDAERAIIEAHQPVYNLVHTAHHVNSGGWETRRRRMDEAHDRGLHCTDWTCRQCRDASHAASEPCSRYPRCVTCQRIPFDVAEEVLDRRAKAFA